MDIDLKEVPNKETPSEEVSLKSKPKKEATEYEAVKLEISKNIQKFDKKVKVHTESPYSFNSVSLKKREENYSTSQTATDLITNPTYNTIGKFLGVDTVHDWDRDCDKVFTIVEWAKQKVGDDLNKIMKWLGQQSRTLPNMGTKTIDNLYIYARMKLNE